MKRLRSYYERELATLHEFHQEFARQFPAQARAQGIVTGADGGDPHITRFIQASALSNARTAQLIDDNDAKVTEALLSVNYPHYLRPFPACAIVHFDVEAEMAVRSSPLTIERGTMMSWDQPDAPPCKFRTIFDVSLAPIRLSDVAFKAIFHLPPELPRYPAVTSSLSFEIESLAERGGLAESHLATLRLFIDAEQSLCAVTRDILFMRVQTAYLELPNTKDWISLKGIPILSAGFSPNEALIPFGASSHPAYRLLTEYFAFPEKFNFFDIDLGALTAELPAGCNRVKLHLGLSGVPVDSPTARQLANLSSKNFVSGCTPVINLFKHHARPIELTHRTSDYELITDASPAHAYDIYHVDKVHMVRGDSSVGQKITEFRPYYSLRHGDAGGKQGHYYLVRRDPLKAQTAPGHEMRIALIDIDSEALAISDASISIDLTCTNRDLPGNSRSSGSEGELHLQHTAGILPLRLLRAPTRQYRFSINDHWRLIAHLALNNISLIQDGATTLKEVLTLYNIRQSAISQRQIAGITGIVQRQSRTWLRNAGRSALVHGIEIRITLDEDAFAGTGMHLFAQVLDHFLGLSVHINTYSQLTILSHATGKELIRCLPRNGARNLL